MKRVRLLDLTNVSPLRSQTVYHAVGHAMLPETPDTIILASPSSPYVCIGYHQDLRKEVDVDHCRSRGLPIYRREVGGGAVYLDSGQVFAQWIFQPGHLPADLVERFAVYIRPLVETYQALGINAYHRPVNDIHVGGKKIGGTGAAQIGVADVVVGSLMFTFDKKTMAKVLRVSSEKMRDKIVEGLEQYMTTITEQLGSSPPRDDVKGLYVRNCEKVLDAEILPGVWTEREEAAAVEVDRRFQSEEWMLQRGGLRPVGVKIHEDVRIVEGAWKAPGGLLRLTARLTGDRIEDISLSGDFTMLPALGLGSVETALRGVHADDRSVVARVREVYRDLPITSPGLAEEDFGRAFLAAVNPVPPAL